MLPKTPRTPEEVGESLAVYADALAALETTKADQFPAGDFRNALVSGKVTGGLFFETLNIGWGVLPWGKGRRRAVRLFLELLAFNGWIVVTTLSAGCGLQEEEERILDAFYSHLETRVPAEHKRLVIGARLTNQGAAPFVPDSLTKFLVYRCAQYEVAMASGQAGVLERANILTRDVPDLNADPTALLKLAFIMSEHFRAHTEPIHMVIAGISEPEQSQK